MRFKDRINICVCLLTALASLYKIINAAGDQKEYNQREEDTGKRTKNRLLIALLKSIEESAPIISFIID